MQKPIYNFHAAKLQLIFNYAAKNLKKFNINRVFYENLLINVANEANTGTIICPICLKNQIIILR